MEAMMLVSCNRYNIPEKRKNFYIEKKGIRGR
jgi:hypothetical protein